MSVRRSKFDRDLAAARDFCDKHIQKCEDYIARSIYRDILITMGTKDTNKVCKSQSKIMDYLERTSMRDVYGSQFVSTNSYPNVSVSKEFITRIFDKVTRLSKGHITWDVNGFWRFGLWTVTFRIRNTLQSSNKNKVY